MSKDIPGKYIHLKDIHFFFEQMVEKLGKVPHENIWEFGFNLFEDGRPNPGDRKALRKLSKVLNARGYVTDFFSGSNPESESINFVRLSICGHWTPKELESKVDECFVLADVYKVNFGQFEVTPGTKAWAPDQAQERTYLSPLPDETIN